VSEVPFKTKNVPRLAELTALADQTHETTCSVDVDLLKARVEELAKLAESPTGGALGKALERVEELRAACKVVMDGGNRARALVREKELEDRYFMSYREGQILRQDGELEKAASVYEEFLAFCDALRAAEHHELYEPIVAQYLHDPADPDKRTAYDRKHGLLLADIRKVLAAEREAADAEAAGDYRSAYEQRVAIIRGFQDIPFGERFTLPVRVASLPTAAAVFRTKMGGVEERLGATPLVVPCDVNGSTRLSLRLDGFEEAEFTHDGVDDARGADYRSELPKLVLWRVAPDVPGQATAATTCAGRVILCSRKGVVRALSPLDGREEARFTVESGTGSLQGVTAAPIAFRGRLLLFTLDKTAFVLDGKTLELVRRLDLEAPVRWDPAVCDSGVVALDESGHLMLLDEEGTTLWRKPVGRSCASGEILSSKDLPKSPPWGRLTLHGDRVYVGSDAGWVVAYDVPKAEVAWTVRVDGPVRGGMKADGASVVVGTRRGNVHVLDAGSGEETAGGQVEGVLDDGIVPLAEGVATLTRTGRLSRFDARMKEIWRFSAGDEVNVPPQLLDGAIVVVTRDGTAVAIEP
jgi:outer membrane protein assembly factor BamB